MNTIDKSKEMLESDENLALEYKKLVESKDAIAMKQFMKKYGVSDEDIDTLISKELSDDELDGVAGGFPGDGLSAEEKRAENENLRKQQKIAKEKREQFWSDVKDDFSVVFG